MDFYDAFFYGDKPVSSLSTNDYIRLVGSSKQEQLRGLQNTVKSTFERGVDRLAQNQTAATVALQGELAYQADMLRHQMAAGMNGVADAITQSSYEISYGIQQMSDYLGAGMSEIRWGVERNNELSAKILNVLLDSLSNESRQYYEQGVKCYDTGEYEIAKERLNKALEANRTNYFAYQYLGFVGVAENKSEDAIRSFDLARKFADSGYHQALALSHLARSHQATGDLNKAIELASDATKAHAEMAKFWYESAGYAARLGKSDLAIPPLEEAIKRDKTYWALVASDIDFEMIRAEVVQLQGKIRESARNNARQAIDRLRHTLDTAQSVGVEDISDDLKELRQFENSYDGKENYYVYLDLEQAANKTRHPVLSKIENTLKEKIDEKKKAISQHIASQVIQSREDQKSIDKEIATAASDGVDWFSAGFFCVLFFLLAVGMMATISSSKEPPLMVACFLLAIFVVMIMAGKSTKRIAQAKIQTAQSKKELNETEFSKSKFEMEEQLNQLQNFLERFQADK